jgi:hypothetical protein
MYLALGRVFSSLPLCYFITMSCTNQVLTLSSKSIPKYTFSSLAVVNKQASPLWKQCIRRVQRYFVRSIAISIRHPI